MGTLRFEDTTQTTVKTEHLRVKLNRLYKAVRLSKAHPSSGLFEYLWDIKELALLQGHTCVQIPNGWLAELDQELSTDHAS